MRHQILLTRTYVSFVGDNFSVHGLEKSLALRMRPRGQSHEVVVVHVHALGRFVAVLEQRMLGLGPIFADWARGRPHFARASVVLMTRATHLTLGRGMGHMTKNATIETFRFLLALESRIQF